MSDLLPLVDELTQVTLNINQIFLDPNNPRFVGPDWEYVSPEYIVDQGIQEAAKAKLITGFGVEKLASNIEVNGFLPIDRVVVKKISETNYVVLEGNRRICAAKMIAEAAKTNSLLNPKTVESVQNIDCLEYTGAAEDASWIFQGIRHISGISDWPAFNKAKLLVEQMQDEGLSLSAVARRFGLTPHGAGQWVRGYCAFQQAAEESDFIHELDVQAYPYFQELFSRSNASIRDWLEWDEGSKSFENNLNFNEFIGWLYPKEEDNSEAFGKWDRRILKTRDDIRQISYLLKEDSEVFARFRRELDVERAYSEAMAKKYARQEKDVEKQIHEVIADCTRALENIPFRLLKDEEIKGKILTEITKLEDAIAFIKE